ncbi:MAG: photosynthetic complex putative assembly protein PuhB [Pseudomonadota bacterium]
MSQHHDPDFDFEPIAGLPTKLPEDETILWSGSPEAWRFGHHVFRTRLVFAFFVVLAASSIFSGLNHGAETWRIALTFATLLSVGAAIVGFAMCFGWLMAINTVYTITNKRLVIRHGVTMPMAINVPFSKVANAAAKIRDDGNGDVSLSLLDGNRLALYAAWPHNRPWSWQGTAPAIRCVADAAVAARVLADSLAQYVTERGQAYERTRPKVPIRTAPAMDQPTDAPQPAALTTARA